MVSSSSPFCPECRQMMELCEHGPDWRPGRRQKYYFKRWFKCGNCNILKMIESERVILQPVPDYRIPEM